MSSSSIKDARQYQKMQSVNEDVLSGKHSTIELARKHGYSPGWIREVARQLGVKLPKSRESNEKYILKRLREEGTSEHVITAIATETGRVKSWIEYLAKRVAEEAAPGAKERHKAEMCQNRRKKRLARNGVAESSVAHSAFR